MEVFALFYILYVVKASELTINPRSTQLIGTVGQNVLLHWNIIVSIDIRKVYLVEVYINVGGKRTEIISSGGGVTAEGEKLFRASRISRSWIRNAPNYFFGLTIKNILYSDEYIFNLEVVYEKVDGSYENDDSSSINLKVKGGVDVCGDGPQDTIEFEKEIKETLYLYGNPKPNVSITINGKSNFLNGDIEDKKTKKYKYEVKIATKPEYCGQSIDYKLSGYDGITAYKTKVIPKPVNDLTYIINATNCTIVIWEQVDYGKCSFELKYQLKFLTHNGEFQQETKMNQTTFADCYNRSIRNASFVMVRAVYKGKFIGKYSERKKRERNIDGISTTIKAVIEDNSSSTNKMSFCFYMMLIFLVISILLVIIIMVFCFYMYKNNTANQNLFRKTTEEKEEIKRTKIASQNQKCLTKEIALPDDVQPDVQCKPTGSNKQSSHYTPLEPIQQYNPNSNYFELLIKRHEEINGQQSNYDVVADSPHKDIPVYESVI